MTAPRLTVTTAWLAECRCPDLAGFDAPHDFHVVVFVRDHWRCDCGEWWRDRIRCEHTEAAERAPMTRMAVVA